MELLEPIVQDNNNTLSDLNIIDEISQNVNE